MMKRSFLYERDFWGICKVVETILCLEIGSKDLFYCSLKGLFHTDNYLYIRVFDEGFTYRLIPLKREGLIIICRDPYEMLKILLRERFFTYDMLKKLIDMCSLTSYVYIDLFKKYDDYDLYIINVMKDLKRCCDDPRHVPRICRAENILTELMIMSTRTRLFLEKTGEHILAQKIYMERLVNDFMRLSNGKDPFLEAFLELIKGSL
jgi:hypothetical protein